MKTILITIFIALFLSSIATTYVYLQPVEVDDYIAKPVEHYQEPAVSMEQPVINHIPKQVELEINQNNLFHPDRHIPQVTIISNNNEASYRLIAIAEVGDQSFAQIEITYPRSKQRSRPSVTNDLYKVNDYVGKQGYALNKLTVNSVVLKKGNSEKILIMEK